MRIIFFLLLFFSFSFSLSLKEEQVEGMYIYNFAKNIVWDSKIDSYHFHIVSKSEDLNSFFRELAKSRKLNSKSIKVTFGELSSYIKPELIFIDSDSLDKYESFFERYQGDRVLIVSDRYDNQRKVMINLLPTKDKKIHFEINRANILNQGLKVSPDMILLGGTEIDVAKLYKKSQDLLTKEEKKNIKLQKEIKSSQRRVDELRVQIDSQKETIEKQLKEIETRKKEIDKQKSTISTQLKEIDKQKESIKLQESEIKKQKDSISKQNRQLSELLENIKIQKENVSKQEKAVEILKEEQVKQNLKIVKRNEILADLNVKIEEQQKSLVKKDKTITTQESTIYTLAILIGIIIILIIFVLISYKKLSRAKVQIEAQAKDLEEAKGELEEMHKQITDSIEYASLIQHNIIPDENLFKNNFKDFFTIWEPRDVVGGDIYLFEELPNDRGFILMVIDCTGHGVAGAFVTMLTKAIERQIISEINTKDEISPAEILSTFNKSIKSILKQEDSKAISNAGFDGGVLYYDKKNSIVQFAGAETPLFIIQNDNLEMIKGDRHSIGYKKSKIDYKFSEYSIDVSKDSILYLTTDGYLDQTGERNFMFGKKRFKELLEANYKKPFSKQKEVFIDEFYNYMGDRDRKDDVTVVGLKI